MATYQVKKDYIKRFENLVGRRFETLGKLEKHLTQYLQADNEIRLDFSEQNYEIEHTSDWNLIGRLENDFISCDFDIYFLWDRGNNLYITEVGYDFI